ncbi:ECF-type sigma factor [Symmachiella dynata]|uniref:ECF-type sigma factor n=1 Tax=Symmachiella dynata TaxID=2527995 RepID=UPI0030EE4D23
MGEPELEITVWMQQLADDSPEAFQEIWNEYYGKLVKFAMRRMERIPKREADEEDVALSAFHSLHRGVQEGRFPQFDNRDDLWKLLLTIASGKIKKRIRHQVSQKRGGGDVRGESVFGKVNQAGGLDQAANCEPTPEFADQVIASCDDLLSSLDNSVLREIAILKLEGYTNDEVAAKMQCATRSVERKLKRIRAIWQSEMS